MANRRDGQHDFDFLFGRWVVRNRRLTQRLQGCTEWEEFSAEAEIRPLLGGIGHLDEFHAQLPDGTALEGMTVRIYDAALAEWRIFWADDRIRTFLPPMVGRFEDGTGTFFGDDVCNGTPVQVVFHWTHDEAETAHWDQAFSADGGATWELNWEMFLSRIDPHSPASRSRSMSSNPRH